MLWGKAVDPSDRERSRRQGSQAPDGSRIPHPAGMPELAVLARPPGVRKERLRLDRPEPLRGKEEEPGVVGLPSLDRDPDEAGLFGLEEEIEPEGGRPGRSESRA